MTPFRIAFDMQSFFTSSRHRGLGRYSFEVARGVSMIDGPHEVRIVGRTDDAQALADLRREFSHLPPWAVSAITAPQLGHTNLKDWRIELNERLFRRHLMQLTPDVVHIPSPFEHHVVRAPTPWPTSDTLFCATAHDIIPILLPERYFDHENIRDWYYSRIRTLKDADLIFANSEATKKDVVQHLSIDPERVIVTLLGVDDRFRRREFSPEQKAGLLSRFGLRDKFVMYLGGWDSRKQMEPTIEAFAKLPAHIRETHSLALVCNCIPEERERADNLAKRVGLSPGTLVQTGLVSDDDLVSLYSACKLFFFPSLYEGFGLPVAEAMACGAPVFVSNVSSLPEVAGRSDVTFDPSTPASIAEGLMRAIGDEGLLRDLAEYGPRRAHEFTWHRCAAETLAGYREGLARKSARPATAMASRPPRRRIAFLSPLPPEESGVGTASEELLPELTSYFDITLFSSVPKISSPYLQANLPILPQESFPEHAASFDAVIYQFGNSTFHAQMLDYLRRFPGVVALHDFFLTDLMDNLEYYGGRAGVMKAEAEYSHGSVGRDIWRDRSAMLATYPVNRRVLDQATGVIFHSEFNLEQVRRFYPAGLTTPLRVVPQLRRVRTDLPSKTEARARLGIGADEFLMTSYGMTHFRKCSQEVVDGFVEAAAKSSRPMTLAMVGKNDGSPYGAELLRRLEALPAHARGSVTGYIDDRTYDLYLAASDVAVQLRRETRGETSRAVLDTLAAGLPTIVNAYAGFNDYPEGVVLKTPARPSGHDVADRLLELMGDPLFRAGVGRAARDWIAERHRPSAVAAQYVVAVEEFMAHHGAVDQQRFVQLMARLAQDHDVPFADLARQFVDNEVDPRAFTLANRLDPV